MASEIRAFGRGVLTSAALAALVGSTGGAAAQQTTWRMDSLVVETRPEAKDFAAFANRVLDKSGGRLKIDVYYGKSLGINEPEHLRAIQSGAIEMIALLPSLYSRDAPRLSVILPQGVVSTKKEMAAVAPVLQSIYQEALGQWGAVVVGYVYPPFHNISAVCKDPVQSLSDLKPKKLRVWAREQVNSFNKLGVSAQIMSQNDIYLGIQTGVIDCALYGVPTVPTISLQEVAKYASPLHAFSALPFGLSVNQKTWDGLPNDLKAVVKEAGDWITQKSLAEASTSTIEADAAAKLSAEGFKILGEGFPEADKRAYYNAASDMWAEQAKALGPEASKYRDQVIGALESARK